MRRRWHPNTPSIWSQIAAILVVSSACSACASLPASKRADAIPRRETADFTLTSPTGGWEFSLLNPYETKALVKLLRPIGAGRTDIVRNEIGFCREVETVELGIDYPCMNLATYNLPLGPDSLAIGGWADSIRAWTATFEGEEEPSGFFQLSRKTRHGRCVLDSLAIAGRQYLRLRVHDRQQPDRILKSFGQALLTFSDNVVLIVLLGKADAAKGSTEWDVLSSLVLHPAP
jgi:hypothetical protein